MYVVSTEDKEIAVVRNSYGAKVILLPPELATDDSSTLSVLQNVVKQISCTTFILLQATSPIRHKELMGEFIEEYLDNKYDSLATGFVYKYLEYGSNKKKDKILDVD